MISLICAEKMSLKSTLKLFNPLVDSLLVAQISVTDSKIDKRN